MKYYKKNKAKLLSGIGFYVVMGVCMIAVGFAAYSAMDAARMNNKSDDTKYYEEEKEEINQQENITLEPINPESSDSSVNEEPLQQETKNVDTESQTVYFSAPLSEYEILKEFSADTLQYSSTYNDMRLHTGLDLVPFENLLVLSCANGTVASIDEGTIMGNVITIEHGDNIFIRYCGVKNIKVSVGEEVTANTPIAEIGTVNNECADEAHLHLEVLKDGNPIDPTTVIPLN